MFGRSLTVSLTLILSVGLLASPSAFSQDNADKEDIVKRLFFGDWQDALMKGKVELVVRPEFMYTDDDDSDDKHEGSVNLELETFPGENWELELELELFKYIDGDGSSESGVGDLELSVDYRFYHNLDPVVDFRVGFEFVQPLGDEDDGLSDGFRRYAPNLSLRWKWGPVHFFSKVAYEFLERESGGSDGHHRKRFRHSRRLERFEHFERFERFFNDDDDSDILEYHFAFFYPKDAWRFGAEFAGETNEVDDGDEHELTFVPQIRYQKTGLDKRGRFDDFEFGLGFPIGLTDDTTDWGVMLQGYLGFELRASNR